MHEAQHRVPQLLAVHLLEDGLHHADDRGRHGGGVLLQESLKLGPPLHAHVAPLQSDDVVLHFAGVGPREKQPPAPVLRRQP
eukprot:2934325-Pyramimonas_sp.AAC.1